MVEVCVSKDSCKIWDKSGKNDFYKLCKSLLPADSSCTASKKDIKRAIYELCYHAVKGRLKVDQAAASLVEIAELQRDLVSTVVDVLCLMDCEIQGEDKDPEKQKFVALISACSNFVPDCLLKERLELETLENIGKINSRAAFQQKYVKTKTRLYYKQQKYNLLREESEGYAKLKSELSAELTEKVTPSSLLETIESLIGCFNLDPNRVLDIILDVFERRTDQQDFFIRFIQCYMSDHKTVCHILGFKFHYYQESGDTCTPDSLYKLAAILLQNKLIDLDTIYPHLSPKDSVIYDEYKKVLVEAKQYAKKLTVVSLADKKDDKVEELDIEIDKIENNQKLGLCHGLLRLGDWTTAKMIMDKLPQHTASARTEIAKALCALVHVTIDPLYRKCHGMSERIIKSAIKSSSEINDKLQQISTYEDFTQTAVPMICYLGPNMYRDPVLLVKLMRIARVYVEKRSKDAPLINDEIFLSLLTMLDQVLVPSLSLMDNNCSLSEELWSVLKLLPYQFRYRLYGHWKNETYSQHPQLIRAKTTCLEKARYIMKRLTKENVKQLGRHFGKLSHSNPAILFEYVLSQIQKYDNFIVPVVDSLKYLTSLSYDILAFCIIEALANPDKERMKFDDMNISGWLQSLASFSGSIFKKYPIELAGILQYVANQLKAGKSFDLLILREIVQKMSGIEISEEVTDVQLDAMAGGELLRQEGGYFSQVRNTKKSSNRLKEAVLEHSLAMPLCFLMSQQRDCIIYQEGEDRHLKLVGKLYDQCLDTLVQFGSFLSTQLSAAEFVSKLPSIELLIGTYHLGSDAAFFLSRQMYSSSIMSKYEELRKIDKSNKQVSSQQKVVRYREAWECILNPIIEAVKPIHTNAIWKDLTPQFYVTFWTLAPYDLYCPVGAYDKQNELIKKQLIAHDENRDLVQTKKKKEKDRCVAMMDKLHEEQKKQEEHIERVMASLRKESDTWFPATCSTKNDMITQFLQLCVFPRVSYTAIDAVFCAKFLLVLHDLKTPFFSSLICYDRLFCDITHTVTCFTENEAHRYGRFLCTVLETLMRRHADKSIYNKQCAGHPGYIIYRKDNVATGTPTGTQLDYENYRHICHKWQFRTTKAMVLCLESGNYVSIRNALIVLIKILPHYPKVMNYALALERRIDRICQEEKDKRADIYALAVGYSGQLKSKKKTWVPESEFHIKEDKKKTTPASSNSSVPTGKSDSEAGASPKKSIKESNSGTKEMSADKDKNKEKKTDSDDKETRQVKKVEKKEQAENGKTVANPDVKITAKKEKSDEQTKGSSSKSSVDSPSSRTSIKVKKEGDSKDIKEDKEKVKKDKTDKADKGSSLSKDKTRKDGEKKERSSKDKDVKMKSSDKEKTKEEKGKEKSHKSHKESKKDKERESEGREKTEEGQISSTVTSVSTKSSKRRSAEPSPHPEDKDVKKRKVELASPTIAVKEYSREDRKDQRSTKSPCRDDAGDSDQKSDRKRERRKDEDGKGEGDGKKRKSEASETKRSSSVNGYDDKTARNDKNEVTSSTDKKSDSDKKSHRRESKGSSRSSSKEKKSDKHSSSKKKSS